MQVDRREFLYLTGTATLATAVSGFTAAEGAKPMYGLIGGSKAALESVARHLTLEVGDRGVNVNVVKAGLVETDSTRKIPFADRMFAGRTDKSMMGEYYLPEEVKVGLLRFFTRFGRYLVPRYLFYSLWLSSMLITYLILSTFSPSSLLHNLAAILFGVVASGILWFETIKLWQEKPF